jgi:voltage-gated potassium channel
VFLRLPSHLKELRFLQLTLYTLIFLIISPLLCGSYLINVLAQIFILNSLLVSLSAGGPKKRHKEVLWTLWGLSLACYLLAASGVAPALTPLWRSLDIIFTARLLLSCVVVTFAFIFRSHQVNLATIFAAVVAYLFIAFTYAQLYQLISLWQPGSFSSPSQSAASFQVFPSDMRYFSLVTIATLGYGDIVPQMPLTRMLAAVEAVMGQFYVAILVAWLAGVFISHSLRSKQTGADENRF